MHQGLFEALPDKLNERRSSLRTMPNTAKKRPPPASDPPFFGGRSAVNQPIPAPVSTPDTNMATPLRNRTMPQEYLKGATKRMSMPDVQASNGVPYPFTPESVYASIVTPTETVGYSSSQSATPAPLDFGSSALIQGQLPDLKSVMFPGDNPFAYPNQPISTLDTMPSLPFGDAPASISNQYNTPSSMDIQQQFRQRGDIPYEFRQQEGHLPQQFFGINDMSDEPSQVRSPAQPVNHLQVPGQGEEDYWSHAPAKGNFRTGLTPGGPGVNLNLDDIFGNSQGWNVPNISMGLAMPEHGEQQQNIPWSGQGGHHWQ